MKELLSPKQVATSIGVSESSLKRWCDQGVIATERTPGGHRRIRIGEAIRFLREQQHPLVRPEVLGLPVGAGQGPRSMSKAGDALLESLTRGDAEQSRRIVIDLFLSGSSVLRICEELITPAMHAMGDGWECGRVEVYQEHRACEVLNRILYDLRTVLPPAPEGAPVAIGGTPPGDNYRLATLMVELVLVDEGWHAVSLGSSLPFATMAAAAQHHDPALFWLSLSYVDNPEAVREGFAQFLLSTNDDMSVVIGGKEADGLL
ncbi:MAG: B12-binding domain-containing protein, partial [Myxococcota bacterium]